MNLGIDGRVTLVSETDPRPAPAPAADASVDQVKALPEVVDRLATRAELSAWLTQRTS